MKNLTVFFFLVLSGTLCAQDTLIVRAFDYSSTSRDTLVEFPPADKYRKVIMEYGIRCHDLAVGNGAVGCREWDYSCNTVVFDSSRVDSLLVDDGNGGLVYEVRSPSRYELLSLVTPYGNGLDLGPQGVHWEFDVTDFVPVLQGKKRMALIGGGENQEEIHIVFKFVKGIPERDVIDIRPIWPLSLGTNVDHLAQDRLFEPRTLILPQNTAHVKLRSIVTGHGQNGEFTAYNHFLRVDQDIQYKYQVWKECSDIPIAPQGGTWLLDRAGWCPGEPSQVNEFFLPEEKVAQGEFAIDYDIPNIGGLAETRYIINNQVVFYGENNHDHDAIVQEIIRPNDMIAYNRVNPICFQPQFVLRNGGTQILSSLDIEYGIVGGVKNSLHWTGSLEYGEEEVVTIEYPSSALTAIRGPSTFYVRILTADENEDNNSLKRSFHPVAIYEAGTVNLLLTTNKIASDNELFIYNENQEVVYELTDLVPSKGYFEEVVLMNGCYRLRLNDKSQDGLYFWFYANNGEGGLSLFIDNEEVKVFEPDFGSYLQYEFVLGDATKTSDVQYGKIKIYPNPTTGTINIESRDYPYATTIRLKGINGNIVRTQALPSGSHHFSISLNGLSPGHYILEWHTPKGVRTEKVVYLPQ